MIVCYAALLQQKLTDATDDGYCHEIEMYVWDRCSYQKKDGWADAAEAVLPITVRLSLSPSAVDILGIEPDEGNA